MLLKYKSPKARKLSSLTEGVSLVLFDLVDLRIFAAVELAWRVCVQVLGENLLDSAHFLCVCVF